MPPILYNYFTKLYYRLLSKLFTTLLLLVIVVLVLVHAWRFPLFLEVSLLFFFHSYQALFSMATLTNISINLSFLLISFAVLLLCVLDLQKPVNYLKRFCVKQGYVRQNWKKTQNLGIPRGWADLS